MLNKKLKYKFKILAASVLFLTAPFIVYSAGLVPCGGDPPEPPCDFNQLIILIKNIIDFLIFQVATPLAAVAFAWAGIIMLTAGGSQDKIKQAKSIFGWVLIGILIALSAWLVVSAITGALLGPGYSLLGP